MNPRLRRLQADYDQIREKFSGHPHVVVEPVGEQLPPESYRITFKLVGLALDGDKPKKRDVHHVEMSLPARYPVVQPKVVPAAGETIFHPNITDYFCIADHWWPQTKLTDIIVKLGDMIQWKVVNPKSPLDPIAAKWAVKHEGSDFLPVGNVDLGMGSSDSGGELDVQVIGGEPSGPSGTDGSDGEAQDIPDEPLDMETHDGDFELVILNRSVGEIDGLDDR